MPFNPRLAHSLVILAPPPTSMLPSAFTPAPPVSTDEAVYSSGQASPHPPPRHITAPPVPSMSLVCVWTGYGKGTWKRMGTRKTHAYRLFTWPSLPIYEGMHVRLFARTQPGFTGKKTRQPYRWSTYDPHVQGSVADISCTDDGLATITIVNECRCNTVDLVELSAPFHPRVVVGAQLGESIDTDMQLQLHDPHVVSNAEWPGECSGLDCGRMARVAGARVGSDVSRSEDGPDLPDGPDGRSALQRSSSKDGQLPVDVGGTRKGRARKLRPVVRTYASYSWYQEHTVINPRQ